MLLSFHCYYRHYHYYFNLSSNEVDSQCLYKKNGIKLKQQYQQQL